MAERILVLPNIRSCHNVGSMFRSADGLGFTKLFLVGYTAHPPKTQIDKVSLGAETWIPWEAFGDEHESIQVLKQLQVPIIGLEKHESSIPITDVKDHLDLAHNFALIVGNEVDGLSENVLAACDVVAHIIMRGKKESLNVSVAAGIAMHTLTAGM